MLLLFFLECLKYIFCYYKPKRCLQQPVIADKISRFQVSFLLYFLMCYGQCKWKATCVLGKLDVPTGSCPVQKVTALSCYLHGFIYSEITTEID